MRIIGDVHGKYNKYIPIALDSPDGYSVCVGDVGFDYEELNNYLDPTKHFCVPGNHDNHRAYSQHFLGRFGEAVVGNTKFFYIGGAYSIDVKYRTMGIDWWPEEELNAIEMNDCWDLFEKTDCDLMITHDAPTYLVENYLKFKWPDWAQGLYRPSKTNNFLNEIWKVGQVNKKIKRWVFGHHHFDFDLSLNDCRFQCIGELGFIDV